MLTIYLSQVRRQSRSKLSVDFQVITITLVRPSASEVSLYLRSNCVIKLNMVLPPYWLFGLLFDGTKGIINNKNSNLTVIIIIVIITLLII